MKMQQRAGAKISRTKRVNKADIAGSQYDPRASATSIRRMNTRQLDALEGRLSTFLSRKTQFFGGLEGSIITIREKRQFNYAQDQANRARQQWLQTAGQQVGPNGRPLIERRAMVKPTRGHYASVNDPFPKMEKSVRNMNGKFLKDAIARLRDEAKADYAQRLGEKRRAEYNQMSEVLAVPELFTAVNKLTANQFSTLWHLTDFANLVSSTYEAFRHGVDADDLLDPETQLAQEVRLALNAIKWAGTTKE